MNAAPGSPDNGASPETPAPAPRHPSPARAISGFWRRFGAFCIDSLALGAVGMLLGFVFFDRFAHMGSWARAIGFVIAVGYLTWGNSVLGKGKTLGKRLLHIEVVDAHRRHISVGRAALRAVVFVTPFFLNGVTITPPFSLIAILVFVLCPVLGGSILYLAAFNQRTRQSVHDLVTGTYVLRDDTAAAGLSGPVWRGHFVLLGLIAALCIGGVISAGKIVARPFFGRLLATRDALLATGKFNDAGVYVGTTYSSINGVRRQTTYTQVAVICRNRPSDYAATGDDVAKLVLANDPEAAKKDALNITVRYGYDIGIARGWISWGRTLLPSQWQTGAAGTQLHASTAGH